MTNNDKAIHIARHKELHRSLDELVSDFIQHNRDRRLRTTTILELIEWSHQQTIKPDEEVND